jgi:hypothetical protein
MREEDGSSRRYSSNANVATLIAVLEVELRAFQFNRSTSITAASPPITSSFVRFWRWPGSLYTFEP